MKNKVPFAIFLVLTIILFYFHIQAKKKYKNQLDGLRQIVNGEGQKHSIKVNDKYLVLQSKKRQSTPDQTATIIPYTFEIEGKIYEGKIASLGKSFNELVDDSTFYLAQNPEINSVHPKEDYAYLDKNGVWNWRLYLGILTALGAIGSLMPDKKE